MDDFNDAALEIGDARRALRRKHRPGFSVRNLGALLIGMSVSFIFFRLYSRLLQVWDAGWSESTEQLILFSTVYVAFAGFACVLYAYYHDYLNLAAVKAFVKDSPPRHRNFHATLTFLASLGLIGFIFYFDRVLARGL